MRQSGKTYRMIRDAIQALEFDIPRAMIICAYSNNIKHMIRDAIKICKELDISCRQVNKAELSVFDKPLVFMTFHGYTGQPGEVFTDHLIYDDWDESMITRVKTRIYMSGRY